MAAPLPKPLQIPDISRFVKRAAQLRSVKPAIAYWCDYHAVNQIVSRRLQDADEECHAFTEALIDRLEATKAERAGDDAVTDNTAGQAVVEQFAQATFDRAERTLRADKVTRQTADTFDAAATFFELSAVWAPPDAEALQKIKFAKWNAARILRALREGVDPNESNPKLPDAEAEAAAAALDPSDPDVQEITGEGPQPASVEDVPDAPDAAEEAPDAPDDAKDSHGVSPEQLGSPPVVQEDYFPPSQRPQQPFPPPAAALDPFSPSPVSETPALPPPPPAESRLSPALLPPTAPSPLPGQSGPPSWTTTPSAPHPPSSNPPPPLAQPSVPSYPQPPPAPVIPAAVPAPAPLLGGHKDMEKAQKHAKFAISALNFDDVPTAVRELRTALAMLGEQ